MNSLSRLLDLVLSNISCSIIKDDSPIVPEDDHHPALNLSLSYNKPSSKFKANRNLKVYNFRKAIFPDRYTDFLATDSTVIENYFDIDQAVFSIIYSYIISIETNALSGLIAL